MNEKTIRPPRTRMLRHKKNAQSRSRYATRVYPGPQEARDLPRTFSRHRDGGRAARVPAASDRDQYATTERQRDRDRAPVLLQGDIDRPETTRHLVFVYEPRKLPRVLS